MMNNQSIKKLNGKIEFLRFIFAIIILIHHSRRVVGDDECYFLGGSLAVEFFFLLSGYLMMASIVRCNSSVVDLGSETLGFLIRKVKGILPEMLFAYGAGLAVHSIAQKYTWVETVRLGLGCIWDSMLLWFSGLQQKSVNAVIWYISAMLFGMAILYPLLRKWPNIMSRLVLPITALLLLGWLCKNYSSPRNPSKWLGLTYKGNIRAIAELILGTICYQWVQYLKRLNLTGFGKACLTCLEVFLYSGLIAYMFYKNPSNNDYFYILLFMVAITITFSEQAYLCRYFNNPLFYFLGRFSTAIYLSHYFWAVNITSMLPKNATYTEKMLSYLGSSIATAATVYLLSTLVRKYQIGNKLLRLFVKS